MEMLIPDLNERGFLPAGLYISSLSEIEARFGCQSESRKRLMAELKQICKLAEDAGLNRVILGGSFPTSKDSPADLDGVLLGSMDANWDVILTTLDKEQQIIRGVRADFFPATDINKLEMYMSFLCRTRNGDIRGLIEVPILHAPSPRVLVTSNITDWLLEEQLSKAKAAYESVETAIQKEALDKLISNIEQSKQLLGTNEFYRQCLKAEVPLPGKRGVGDVQINSLMGLFIAKADPFRIVDFGCGGGRLIVELATLDPDLLRKVDYSGVDFDTKLAQQTATESGLYEKCNSVWFGNFDESSKWKEAADFVLMVNALHEIPLNELPEVIHNALSLVKQFGYFVVHDMEHLVYGERSFVPWKGEEVRNLLMSESIEIGVRQHQSKSGVPLFTVHAKVLALTPLSLDDIAHRSRQIYRTKELEMINRRAKLKALHGNEREYAYLSVAIANVREQLLAKA